MEISRKIDLLYGPERSGKTTLCHFISNYSLSIKKVGLEYHIETLNLNNNSKKIANGDLAKTCIPTYYDRYCDMPGINPSREDLNINNLLFTYHELQNYSDIRLYLVFEEKYLTQRNGEDFIKLTNEFINTFGLISEYYSRLVLVLTKTTAEFYYNLTSFFRTTFQENFNFIIEYIKSGDLTVFSLEKPLEKNGAFEFSVYKKESFQNIDRDFSYLDCQKIKSSVLAKLKSSLLRIRNLNNNSNILFTSKITDKKYRSSNILCIDQDIRIITEHLLLDSQNIIILPENNSKIIKIEAVGNNPVIEIKTGVLINSENLVVSTSKSRVNFPDPTETAFDSSLNFFRLESICVNGGWTEYASHNNKFIDLIVSVDPDVGKIVIGPKFKIKTNQVDIRLKLFINECMRTKNKIIERFPSIRNQKDINGYLEVCKKVSIPVKIKEALENYVIKLPSIFQLLLDENKLSKFSSNMSEKKDIRKIRCILMERYLEIINKFICEKEYLNTELTREAINNFKEFCAAKLNSYKEGSPLTRSELKKELRNFLKRSEIDKNELLKFYSFYDILSTTQDKDILFKEQLSGDQSIYVNYQSLINRHITSNNLSVQEFKDFSIKHGVLSTSGLSLIIGIGAGTAGRMLVVRSAANAGLRAGIGLTSLVASAIGIGLFIGEIGINVACALAKSGYYGGEYKPDIFIIGLI